jgi:hypothetical protein
MELSTTREATGCAVTRELPAFNGTWKLIIAFIRSIHLFLSWGRPIQSINHYLALQDTSFTLPPCSQPPSVYIFSLKPETNFHFHTEPQEKISLAYSNFYVFWQKTRQKVLLWMVASIIRIQSFLNFLLK